MTFFYLIKREFLLLSRKPLQLCIPLLFFILVCILFPLSTSPNNPALSTFGPGIIWIAILLSSLLSLPHLFSDDYDDGMLDQWIIHRNEMSTMIIIRLLSYWFSYLFPLILLTPIFAQLFHLDSYAIKILMLILLLGTPLIVMQGAIVAAVCVGLRKATLLLAIILLPMYIPMMIFGTTSVTAAELGLPVLFQIDLLCGLFILAWVLGPMVIAFALRIGITY